MYTGCPIKNAPHSSEIKASLAFSHMFLVSTEPNKFLISPNSEGKGFLGRILAQNNEENPKRALFLILLGGAFFKGNTVICNYILQGRQILCMFKTSFLKMCRTRSILYMKGGTSKSPRGQKGGLQKCPSWSTKGGIKKDEHLVHLLYGSPLREQGLRIYGLKFLTTTLLENTEVQNSIPYECNFVLSFCGLYR